MIYTQTQPRLGKRYVVVTRCYEVVDGLLSTWLEYRRGVRERQREAVEGLFEGGVAEDV